MLSDSEEEFMVVICGGQVIGTEGAENADCFSLHDQSTSSLSMPRVGAASLAIDGGRSLWVTGGISETSSAGDLFPTEIVAHQQDASSQAGALMPIHTLSHHCLEKINANTALLIGGENQYTGVDAMTWFYELSTTAKSTVGPPLIQARSRHACGVLRDKAMPDTFVRKIVVVAGGKVGDDTLTDSVEILILDDNHSPPSWELSAEPMLAKIGNAASATTSDQLQMFVIGGTESLSNFDEESTSIFVLQCSGGACNHWTRLQFEMRIPVAQGLAFMIESFPTEGRAVLIETQSIEGN